MIKHQVKLINTTYGAEEAIEVMVSLINDKIKFLDQKSFGIEERLGDNTDHLKQRISELRLERVRLIELLEEYKGSSELVKIDCDINIKIGQHEPVVK